MANQVTSTGLTIQTRAEIVAALTAGFKSIYGPDINLEPNSPDGQLLNLFAQGKIDMLEFIQQVYNSFDPDQATGVSLDLRCAINGIQRKAGTYTGLIAEITFTDAVTLQGLDGSSSNSPFTIADASDNQFYLVNSYTSSGAETATLQFRSAVLGPVQPALDALTIIVTPQYGVTTSNNPNPPISVGVNQESDAALRLRRQRSVTLPSKSWYEGLYASLLADGARDVRIYENQTNTLDANNIPAHSIWTVIDDTELIDGSVEVVDVRKKQLAEIVYIHKNAGCGQKRLLPDADFIVPVSQPDGGTYEIAIYKPTIVQLYITLDAVNLPGEPTIDAGTIRDYIYDYFQNGDGRYKIGQAADASAIVAYIKGILPYISFSNEGVSQTDGTGYVSLIPIDNTAGRPTLQSRWTLGDRPSPGDVPNILINGA